MPKIKDLSSKFKIPVAEKELELLIGQKAMGTREGGLSLYSTKFKRGYGDAVFGSDENGIWLGAAEFAEGLFKVDMDGALVAKSATFKDEDDTTIIDAKGLVSTANFASDNIVNDTSRTTTSTTSVDLPNTTLNFTLARSTKVFLAFIARGRFNKMENTDVMSGNIFMNIDGGDEDWPPGITLTAIDNVNLFSTDSITIPLSYQKIKTLAVGDHTIKLRFNTSGGSGDDRFEVLSTSVMYIVLGK